MNKVDYFVDFISRPYFHQVVAFGTHKLKIESGETIEMPNVVRTVTRSTIVAQYIQYCKNGDYKPLSRSTLFRILEIRQASQRKLMQGLDNTAAEGSCAFQVSGDILHQLVQNGVERTWSQSMTESLNKAKQYLKTNYILNCQEPGSQCADYCRPFALSDSTDEDLRIQCEHDHSLICESCNNLNITTNNI